MPAHAKLAAAVALSLALMGAGTAIAQSTTAPSGHTAYVTLVDVQEVPGPEEVAGEVPCDAPLYERVVRRTLGRTPCLTSDYAYAYPKGEPAPWRGEIQDVEGRMYVDQQGATWRVAQITYRTVAQAPEGGPQLVHAMASEILPREQGAQLSYAMPVTEEVANQSEEELVVDVGPSPSEAMGTPVADTTLASG